VAQSQVEQRLEVLRLMIEQRSEDDLKLVMTWLERQRLRYTLHFQPETRN